MKLLRERQALLRAIAFFLSFSLLLVLAFLWLILAACLTVLHSPRLIPLCGSSLRRRLETYEQANGRDHAAGQDKKTLLSTCVGRPWSVSYIGNLQNKAKIQGTLLAMFEDKHSKYSN